MYSDSELDKPVIGSTATTSTSQTANELKKVPSDLHKYRKRIDSTIQDQRKHREILQSLQDKVMKYRQKTAEAEAEAMNSARNLTQSYPSLLCDDKNEYCWTRQSIVFPSSSVEPLYSQSTSGIPNIHFSSSKQENRQKSIRFSESLENLGTRDDSGVEIYQQRLREEQFRSSVLEEMIETLKKQAESSSHMNEGLTGDLMKLHDSLAVAEQGRIRAVEIAKQREQKLRNEQRIVHRQLYDLSLEIGRLKRKLHEIKSDTEADLESYKSDFERSTKNLESQLKHQEILRSTMKEKTTKDHDTALEEVLKRYDEAVTKGITAEQERNESARKIIFLESALKRTQEEKDRAEESLKKIHQLPELADALGRRTRSVSPVHASAVAHEAIRNIRLALHSKNDEVENQKKELLNAKEKEAENEEKLTKLDKEKRQLEKNLKEEKISKNELEHDKEGLEKQILKLQDRLEKSEIEKQTLNGTILKLNEQLADIRINHQTIIDEIQIKNQQDLDEQFKRMQNEHNQMEENLNQRLQRVRHEAETMRTNISKQRDTQHGLQNELIAERRKTLEKDAENVELKKKIETMELETANLKIQMQQKEITMAQFEKQNQDYEIQEKLLNEKVDELQEEKTTLMEENNSLTGEMNRLRGDLEEIAAKLDNQQLAEINANEQVENYREQIKELEKKNNQIKTAVTDLELKLESTSNRCHGLEKELSEEKKEVAKNLEMIAEITKEKTDLINAKNSMQVEIETVKRELMDQIVRRENASKQVTELENRLTEVEEMNEKLEAVKHTLTIRVKELNDQETTNKETINKLEQTLDEEKQIHKNEAQKIRNETEENLKKLNAEHNAKLEKEEMAKVELQSEILNLKEKLQQLNEAHSKALDDQRLFGEQFNVYRADSGEEVNRLKAEFIQAEQRARKDLIEANEQRLKEKSGLEEKIRNLEKDLKDAKEDIKEELMKEADFKARINVLESKLSLGADMVLKLKQELEELGEKSDELNAQAESERENLRSEIGQLNKSLLLAKQEKENALRKVTDLEKNLQLAEMKNSKQQERLTEIDEEFGNAREEIRGLEMMIAEQKFKIKDLESQLADISDQKEKLRALHKQEEHRNQDLAQVESSLKNYLAILEAKLNESDQRYEKRLVEMRKLNVEKRNLELSFTDKSTELSSLHTLIKQYEHHQAVYIQEIATEKEKCVRLEQELAAILAENKAFKEELAHAVGQIEKKTATNQAVINDLLDNYRTAEKEKLMVMRELEENKGEMEILKHRLDLSEGQRKDLENRVADNEKEKNELQDKLAYYERSAKKVLSFAKAQAPTGSTRTRSQDPQSRYRLASEDDLAISSKLGNPSSIPDLPQTIPYSTSGLNLDISNSMELTFKILKDRIAGLEEESREVASMFRRSKLENEEILSNMTKQKTKINELQKLVRDLEETKTSLEQRLTSSRHVLLAQEETLRAKEQDKKTMKAKIASADMQARDKDARLHLLQKEVVTLKVEIQNLEDDKRKMKQSEENWEKERQNVESALKEARNELDKLQRERILLIKEKETLTHRVKETEQTTFSAQQRCAELERTIERRQQSLSRFQQDESQWKNKIESIRRSATDFQQLEMKIESLKIELETMTQKWKNSESDREQIRREFIDCKSRLNSATLKINENQLIINELQNEKKRCQDRIEILEKYERDNSSVEREVRKELEQARNERLGLLAEVEDLKRQLHKAEITKKEFEAQIQRFERERSALKRHVEAVELDKQRIETAIRQTTTERHALDKSLNAMEKENAELYKNCSQLQAQLTQLERENTNRVSETNSKKKMQFEAEIHRLNHEKRQLEKLIEQREQNYLQKYKMFESQISLLRDQLESERKKRRELLANSAATSIANAAGRRPSSGKPPFRI